MTKKDKELTLEQKLENLKIQLEQSQQQYFMVLGAVQILEQLIAEKAEHNKEVDNA